MTQAETNSAIESLRSSAAQCSSLVKQLVDVAVRLYDRFSPQFTLGAIVNMVDACRRDLDLATTEGLPELVERLAAQRLTGLSPGDPAAVFPVGT